MLGAGLGISGYPNPSPAREEIQPVIDFMTPLYLQFSYRGKKLETDVFATAISPIVIDAYYKGADSGEVDKAKTLYGDKIMAGPLVRLYTNYFFNMKTGIHIELEGGYLYNLDRKLIDAGYTDIDTISYLKGGLGIIYRF